MSSGLSWMGYDSPSQFSREYRRMFGLPPSRDALAMRVYRLMIENKALDRAFYAALVDEILLPMATGKPQGV